MSDNDVFRALAEELSAAKRREASRFHILTQARNKVFNTWQPAIAGLLFEANRALIGHEINFVLLPEFAKIDGENAGLIYPLNGIARATKLVITVVSDPEFAELKLAGQEAGQRMGIATSIFPKDNFKDAIAFLLRMAMAETLVD